MRILIIDNYDSFVYNLAQILEEIGVASDVIRNDKISIDAIKEKKYDAIIISPGPGTPEEKKYFGVCSDVITKLGPTIPILGVCLGHQGIIQCFGGKVVNAGDVRHGKTSPIKHYDDKIFKDVKNPFQATRYHSLIVQPDTLTEPLEVTAWTSDEEIMGLKHREKPIWGVQFHPESILST